MFGSKQLLMQTASAPTGKNISTLAVNALVKTTYSGTDLVFQIADKNHSGYPANSVTLISQYCQVTKGFDNKEPSNYNVNIQKYGNNRYLYSNILQWLNKSGYPWYVAQHTYDSPPEESVTGFLTGFSSTFLSYLLDTNCITAKNKITDGGGSEIVTSKFYLASNTEVGFTNENNIVEGSKLALFNIKSAQGVKPGIGYVNHFLRTPITSYSSMCTYVNEDGNVGGVQAFNLMYFRPLCNIPSTTQISLTPDAQGVYTIL